MDRPSLPVLKIRSGASAVVLRPDVADLACLGELCQAFAEVTGWPLRYVPEPEPTEDLDLLWSAPVSPGVGESPGHLRIDLSGTAAAEAASRTDWHATQRIAGSIAELVNELVKARHALWQREAELAAGVPVSEHEDERGHLAARLEATLQAGAQAIKCDSAALYLLDEATSQLKLRSVWGLPLEKFAEPPRPLAEQMADLEALLGHAIALESPEDMVGSWRSPEPAQAALCVPVSSPTVPLGTLWFFCDRARRFNDEETNIAEVVAGKIASDLDRAVLMKAQTSDKDLHKQVLACARVAEHQLPTQSPPIEGYRVTGWAEQASALGGAFYDWRSLDEKSLLVMLGDACDGGVEAAMASAALRAVLRTEDNPDLDVSQLLSRANRILWETSAGGWWAGMWLGQIQLADGRCDFSGFGRPTGLLLRGTQTRRASEGIANDRSAWASLIKPTEPLGLEPLLRPQKKQIILEPGDSLVVCNRGVLEATDQRGRPLDESLLARTLLPSLEKSPERMIGAVQELLLSRGAPSKPQDRSILVVKRLPA